MFEHCHPKNGLLAHLIGSSRPDLKQRITETGRVETAVVGLGGQGTKHAGLMKKFGTTVTAGIAVEKAGSKIHETIPVYAGINDCLKEHPDLAAASIWKHFSTAAAAAIEVIEAGVPLVVLITEGIPLKDVRNVLAAARAQGTILFGGNTPGLMFPPEGIKIGMLPDVFFPAEVSPGKFGPQGVTVISRSGAILYHLSDALASSGIAQNAVLGVGGDGAIGTTFRQIVPLVMRHEHTHLVVVAGEIGGCQEELLARDIQENPGSYPKPLVALISGANAPEGKTMGHAGAVVSPGQEYGTFQSKKRLLQEAGVPVVNSQTDLIETVREKLGGRTYFESKRYYQKMASIWEALPPKPTWSTSITRVKPNELLIKGIPLPELIENNTLPQVLHLLVEGTFPDRDTEAKLSGIILESATLPLTVGGESENDDFSKCIVRHLLCDPDLTQADADPDKTNVEKASWLTGRSFRAAYNTLWNTPYNFPVLNSLEELFSLCLTGELSAHKDTCRLLQAMVVACVDHGVTPPSAQATILAASVRCALEVGVSSGIAAITDVHGGAGAKAAAFFRSCLKKAMDESITPKEAAELMVEEYIKAGRRIEGLGHRVHTKDPRRDILWKMAEQAGHAGQAVELSKQIGTIFRSVRGMDLPINVDGVIGAIVADLSLPEVAAKAIFVLGRVAGLTAHYFEETAQFPPMRRIDFAQAAYRGPEPEK